MSMPSNSPVIDISSINPKQAAFFKSRKRYIAYGGARGGGKSWAVQRKAPLMALRYPGIKMLLLRRTYKDLERNHVRALEPLLKGIASYSRQDKCFRFPNGSVLDLGYCASESDVLQYQGQEYDIIFIDEATQFTEFQYETLVPCVRGANNFPKRMYLTCNPGGIGHEWVKRLFVDRNYKKDERPDDYDFIKATVFDNKPLLENDPGYVNTLKNLSDDLRKAWLDGDWDIFEGQYFSEFNRSIHVVKPFEIPQDWRRFISIDYGLDMLACLWIALDYNGKAYVYKELYESGLIISEAACRIHEVNGDDVINMRYAPPDMWNRRQETGKSAADIFMENGLYFYKSNNNRVQGWYDLKEWLKPYDDEQGIRTAKLVIFENCLNLIRTLPALQFDEKNPNDVANEPHEITHAPDALRGFVSGRPCAPVQARTPAPDENDDDVNEYSFVDFGI